MTGGRILPVTTDTEVINTRRLTDGLDPGWQTAGLSRTSLSQRIDRESAVKIGFSVRAWVLSAAAGLVIAGTMNSGKTPLAKPLSAQTKTADAESAEQKLRPRHSSMTSMFSRSRRTDAQIEAESLAADSGIRQMSHEVVPADGSESGEPRKLIERPATRDAISNSRPARNQLFPSLFQRPTKAEAQPEQQQIVTPREDDGRSAVQRRLEELYKADGRQMPDMDWDYIPEGGVEQDAPLNPQAAAAEPETIQQVSNNPFKRFFSKISPFSRKKDGNDERPEHVQKMPESLRAEQERVQQQFNAQPLAAPPVALPAAEPQLLSEESRSRGRSARSSRTFANRSSLRRFRPLAGRPPTGASSCRSMTTATSFNRHPTRCPRSTSTRCEADATSRLMPGSGEGLRRARKTDHSEGYRGLEIHATTSPARTRQQPAWAHMQLTDRTTVAKVPLTGLSSGLWLVTSPPAFWYGIW